MAYEIGIRNMRDIKIILSLQIFYYLRLYLIFCYYDLLLLLQSILFLNVLSNLTGCLNEAHRIMLL